MEEFTKLIQSSKPVKIFLAAVWIYFQSTYLQATRKDILLLKSLSLFYPTTEQQIDGMCILEGLTESDIDACKVKTVEKESS